MSGHGAAGGSGSVRPAQSWGLPAVLHLPSDAHQEESKRHYSLPLRIKKNSHETRVHFLGHRPAMITHVVGSHI